MISLRAFGSVDLQGLDGRSLRAILAQPKRLALLAYLASTPGIFHRRDTLLAVFWPELDTRRARDALNQAVRFLRKELGDSSVLVSRGDDELAVDEQRLWFDVAAFRGAIEAGNHAEALDLYRGDLLEGFFLDGETEFRNWLERERARLRGMAARAARALAETREADERFTTAVASARRAVELSDADERGVRGLLELLDRLGDRAGAIHAYEEFARRLANDLDAQPADETKALIAGIRARVRESAAPSLANAPPKDAVTHVAVAARTTTFAPPRDIAGTELNGWQIVRELGRGGMATVYLAKDLKHDRHVALKVMHSELASSIGAERFLREIQIMARLAHPHILPLIDSGAAAGTLYLVAPFVEGESLKERISRDGCLAVDDALRFTREIARALDYAHRHGVVHRDIKPANVLLQDGQALVADFGIARALRAAESERVTTTGLSPGTPAYMSPEQAAGEIEIDGRSDVYSLGAVLYEMLTGNPPHIGPDAQSVLAKVLTEPVASVRSIRSDVPAHAEAALLKALSKNAGDRFESAGAFADALTAAPAPHTSGSRPVWWRRVWRRRVAYALAAPGAVLIVWGMLAALGAWRRSSIPDLDANTVAVLPFTVRAPDSSFNYLREGMLDLFNARLTGAGVPRVVDAGSLISAYTAAVRKNGGDLPETAALALGQRFGAGVVLLGEVVATRERTTIAARLYDVATGKMLVEQSETGTTDVITLATRLASRLLAKSVGESSTRLSALSDSVEAVKAYIVGLRSYRAAQLQTAFDELGRALEIDPTFASAALWRAYAAWGVGVFGTPAKRRADSVAWSLRGRLARRDSLVLAALPSIGPRYPEPSTASDQASAWEHAATANPDRADVWAGWSNHLIAWGLQAGIGNYLTIAAIAADSAIALDSSFVRAYRHRVEIALLQGDTTALRRYRPLWYRVDSAGNPSFQWAIARKLGDSARAKVLFERIVAVPGNGAGRGNMELWSAGYGFASIDDADRVTQRQLARVDYTPAQRVAPLIGAFGIAMLRGQLSRAAVFVDSAPGLLSHAIWAAIADSAFAPLARQAVKTLTVRLEALREPEARANALCNVHMWRAHSGDTANTRAAIEEMRRLVKPLGPAPGWRVGNLGVCPLLLEAWLDRRSNTRWKSTSLDRLETILLRGPLGELPHNLAYLMAARWREEQGDPARALAMVRRIDPMARPLIHPAKWRLEGRLAAAVGDSAGAIHAYQRFLEIRDRPDSGVLAAEVDEARQALSALVRGGRRASKDNMVIRLPRAKGTAGNPHS